MKRLQHYHRRLKLCCIEAAAISLTICLFLFPSFEPYKSTGNNVFNINLNGTLVGSTASEEKALLLISEARKKVARDSGNNDLVFMELETQITGEEVFWKKFNSDSEIVENIAEVMKCNTLETLHRSYTVKINETAVNLASHEEVYELLLKSLSPYDSEGIFDVELCLDSNREINVLEAKIVSKEEKDIENTEKFTGSAGIEAEFERIFNQIEPAKEKDFDDFELGLKEINYAEKIEVVEAYLLEEELNTVEQAVDLVTKEQETQIIYKVKSGDTLSQISIDNDIPMEELIAINDALVDENTTIRIDQELVITVPEPDLSILWKDEQVYTEDYEAEVQYVPNDEWYTTQKVTLQEPSAGRRKVAAIVEYKNNTEVGREILKEEVYAQAIPKIVERGTKIPPTYIKPISGGRVSSRFGGRNAPTKGASTNHKGIDWAIPTGTSVVASNGGTVSFAGWGSGYGYVVYINHADGRQTRYGHLSKVLVKSGQTVSQGQKIALSGNTGRSTGPHLHFEIRINGTAVNPVEYLN